MLLTQADCSRFAALAVDTTTISRYEIQNPESNEACTSWHLLELQAHTNFQSWKLVGAYAVQDVFIKYVEVFRCSDSECNDSAKASMVDSVRSTVSSMQGSVVEAVGG